MEGRENSGSCGHLLYEFHLSLISLPCLCLSLFPLQCVCFVSPSFFFLLSCPCSLRSIRVYWPVSFGFVFLLFSRLPQSVFVSFCCLPLIFFFFWDFSLHSSLKLPFVLSSIRLGVLHLGQHRKSIFIGLTL